MKKYISSLPFIIILTVVAACSFHSVPGYEINGTTWDKSLEGKTIYLKDPYDNAKVYDSVKVVSGKFAFADTAHVKEPYIRILSAHTDVLGLEYHLPVVIENGTVSAVVGDIVCISGTGLNDRLQDFLLGITKLSSSIEEETEWTPEKIKSEFSALLEGFISTNADNVVGVYIYKAYSSSLSESARQSIPEKFPWIKEQLEK